MSRPVSDLRDGETMAENIKKGEVVARKKALFSLFWALNCQKRKHLKHFPGLVLPALPARCCALAFEIGLTNKLSTLILGLYTFCFEKPGSTTYTMPSIVSDVSAIFVDTTTLRPGGPSGVRGGGGASKIRCCCCGGNDE